MSSTCLAPFSHFSSDFELGSNPASSSGEPVARLRYSAVYTGSARTCDVRNLEPATTYSVRVRAHNSMGGSAWSEAAVVMTASAAPGPPAGLKVEAPCPGELRVTWQPPLRDNGAPIAAYLLEVAAVARSSAGALGSSGGSGKGSGGKGGGGSSGKGGGAAAKSGAAASWSKVWQGAETSYTATGLSPGRKYMFRVRASNAQGLGPWCETGEGRTLPAAPSAPPHPTVTQRSAAALKLRWALPAEDNGAPVTAFVLQARPAGGGDEFRTVYSGPELATRADGLQPNTIYELRLAAVNRAGQGPWSEVETAATALQPPPPPTRVSAVSDEGPPPTLRVRWEAAEAPGPAAAEAVGYEVEAQPVGVAAASGGGTPLHQRVGRIDSATLAQAAPGCTYLVHVRSVGAGGSGHSAWSEKVRVEVPACAAALVAAVPAAAAAAAAAAAHAGSGDGGDGEGSFGEAGRLVAPAVVSDRELGRMCCLCCDAIPAC
jgi:hypothetical protein